MAAILDKIEKEVNKLDNESDTQHSQASVDGLGDDATLYDKKCLLVDRQIDAFGMGRYQWMIWSLCGLGYLIDLMWAQAFGLVLSPLQQELGFGNDETGKLSTVFSVGLTAGAFVWGILVDVIGRQWAFNLTVLIACVFGLCLGAPDDYNTILVLTALTGFGVGGNIPIDTTITLEFTPDSKRYLLPLLSVFQPLGVVICSVMAYGFIPVHSCSPNFSEEGPLPSCKNVDVEVACCKKDDNVGWRYLLYTLGALTLLIFVLRSVVFQFQESPKFLLYRGKDAQAIEVLENIALYNKTTCSLTLEQLQAVERGHSSISRDGMKEEQPTWSGSVKAELSRFKILFSSPQMIRLTVLVWLTYICDFTGFTVAGSYLPRIIALKNGALHLSLDYTYRSYILIYLPGTIGVLLGSLLYRTPNIGRKYTMVVSSLLMSVSIFVFSTVNSPASNIGLNAMEYFFQSMFNAVLYGWTPEAFPAQIRGTACGVASFWGRLFGIISPLIAQHLYARSRDDKGDVNSVLYLAAGVTFGCVITTALLPGKLLKR
ncbi:MFS general substrate transporter [Lizonia empirigonia]|nr:MFS general substrate transporter [Lizonia empirigonia]